MTDHLTMLAALCAPGRSAPALTAAMFLAGATGGALHCAPMCGPFVLGQVADRLARAPAAGLCGMTRLSSALLLPYHAGRLATYAGLGAAAAMIGGTVQANGPLRFFSSALLLLAACLFAAQALRRMRPPSRRRSVARSRPGSGRRRSGLAVLANATATAGRRFDRTRWPGALVLGLLLGFLPCGLLYAALTVAAASADPATGALAMAAFGLGTIPALVSVGLAGHTIRRLSGPAAGGGFWAVVPSVLLLGNAALLCLLAWQRLGGAV